MRLIEKGVKALGEDITPHDYFRIGSAIFPGSCPANDDEIIEEIKMSISYLENARGHKEAKALLEHARKQLASEEKCLRQYEKLVSEYENEKERHMRPADDISALDSAVLFFYGFAMGFYKVEEASKCKGKYKKAGEFAKECNRIRNELDRKLKKLKERAEKYNKACSDFAKEKRKFDDARGNGCMRRDLSGNFMRIGREFLSLGEYKDASSYAEQCEKYGSESAEKYLEFTRLQTIRERWCVVSQISVTAVYLCVLFRTDLIRAPWRKPWANGVLKGLLGLFSPFLIYTFLIALITFGLFGSAETSKTSKTSDAVALVAVIGMVFIQSYAIGGGYGVLKPYL